MDSTTLLKIIEKSIEKISNPRFFETERGYQGELSSLISAELRESVECSLISELEYQKKKEEHGMKIRPDIVIHEPFDESIHSSRRDENYLVIELKKKGMIRKILEDFDSIDSMIETLDYQLGVFINISSTMNFKESYPGKYIDKLVCFAVQLSEDGTQVEVHKS